MWMCGCVDVWMCGGRCVSTAGASIPRCMRRPCRPSPRSSPPTGLLAWTRRRRRRFDDCWRWPGKQSNLVGLRRNAATRTTLPHTHCLQGTHRDTRSGNQLGSGAATCHVIGLRQIGPCQTVWRWHNMAIIIPRLSILKYKCLHDQKVNKYQIIKEVQYTIKWNKVLFNNIM